MAKRIHFRFGSFDLPDGVDLAELTQNLLEALSTGTAVVIGVEHVGHALNVIVNGEETLYVIIDPDGVHGGFHSG
ncbi:hypothetical protein GCM10022226_74260 [Sphaerisporangium flaviroseum]|uniref:Uncharacterized protein n=1 Tax=Sphaerisporangium flaviroseum TaxID=509199 RepID=A0ABP7JCY8_9ACTN